MFYTGIDPVAKERVYVPSDPEEKRLQRAMLHFNKPENADLVRKALRQLGRTDLIGYGPEALVRPESEKGTRSAGADPGSRGGIDRGARNSAERHGRQAAGKSSFSRGQKKKTGDGRNSAAKENDRYSRSGRTEKNGNRSAGGRGRKGRGR